MARSERFWHHWEEAGILAGAALIAVELFAILTPYLSGPLFNPVLILAGFLAIYVCAMLLGGANHDQETHN